MVEPVKSSRLLPNGSRVVDIDKSWKDKNVTLSCSATNTLDEQQHLINTSIVISIIG
jgi:hypothetical protein